MNQSNQNVLKPQKKLNNSQLDSAVKLFENTSIFKALLRVVFLAVIVSFCSGLYVFADQVLMQKVLPLNTDYVNNTLNSIGYFNDGLQTEIQNSAQNIKDIYGTNNGVINEITRLVNAGNSPITVFCTAISLLTGLGSAIVYSKALGFKDEKQIRDIWKNSFYNCLFFSIISTLIVLGLIYAIIPAEISNKGDPNSSQVVSDFIVRLQNKAREYAIGYCLIIVIFNLFNNYTIYYVSLLNSEGKNIIPTIVVLISNGVNILLDWVLLRYSGVLGIYGSAVATIISYVFSVILFTGYLSYKNFKNQTFMIYKNLFLKNEKLNLKMILYINGTGVASFFRNASTAIYSIVQLSIFASITYTLTHYPATYFTSIMGAVTPIYNLFFSAMIGILRGARTVISYNHGRGLTKNIYKAFWISTIMSFGYGLIFFVIGGPLLTSGSYANGGMLALFNIFPGNANYWDAVRLLNINMSQLLFYAFIISGMLYFQSVAKNYNALFTSILYGIILGVPLLYIISAIAVSANSIDIYIYAPIIISFLAGLITFGYTLWYLYLKKPSSKIKMKKIKIKKDTIHNS